VRPVSLKGEAKLQFTSHFDRQHTHENFDVEETIARVAELLGAQFRHCTLFTTTADISVRVARSGRIQLAKSAPTLDTSTAEHNRTKSYLIPDGTPCAFLHEIGVMTAEGKVRTAKYAKYRQINRFLELVDDVLGVLPKQELLHVVDFGCGKSYLTFALHHLLTVIHQRETRIVGLDSNPDVIASCRRVVKSLGLSELEFEIGGISDYKTDQHVHLMVSLHACDTATDAAIARAIGWGSEAILAVPCCQHELAAKLQNDKFAALLQHGILKERFGALITDALRAKMLEICGYETQVIEFIDMEHTAKNLLIRATRAKDGRKKVDAATKAYEEMKQAMGLERIAIETLVGRDAEFCQP
jgi:hypothetical protein